MTMLRRFGCLLALLAACGGDDGEGTSSSSTSTSTSSSAATSTSTASGGGDECTFSDLCSKITPAEVQQICGVDVTSGMPIDSAMDPYAASVCQYEDAMGGLPFGAERLCFTDAGMAQMVFDADRAEQVPNEVTEDLPGVGDQAYFRRNTLTSSAEVKILQGALLVAVGWESAPDAPSTKTCLTTVAEDVLAAQ